MTNFKAIFGSFVKDAYDILINESTAEIVVISKNSKAVEKVRTVASENDNRWKVSHVPADKVFRHDFWSKYLDFFSLAQNRKILESMGPCKKDNVWLCTEGPQERRRLTVKIRRTDGRQKLPACACKQAG